MRARDADGFTLPELLVAMTILGIIVVAIGAMITTAFRTTTIVSEELQGSRAPKTTSRYWAPDVEQAGHVYPRDSQGCGTGGTPVAGLTSTEFVSAFDHTDRGDVAGTPHTVAYWDTTTGAREQLVRWVCAAGGPPTSLVIVSDLKEPPQVSVSGTRATLKVSVPDRSRTDRTYSFDVTAASQVSTTGAP